MYCMENVVNINFSTFVKFVYKNFVLCDFFSVIKFLYIKSCKVFCNIYSDPGLRSGIIFRSVA